MSLPYTKKAENERRGDRVSAPGALEKRKRLRQQGLVDVPADVVGANLTGNHKLGGVSFLQDGNSSLVYQQLSLLCGIMENDRLGLVP